MGSSFSRTSSPVAAGARSDTRPMLPIVSAAHGEFRSFDNYHRSRLFSLAAGAAEAAAANDRGDPDSLRRVAEALRNHIDPIAYARTNHVLIEPAFLAEWEAPDGEGRREWSRYLEESFNSCTLKSYYALIRLIWLKDAEIPIPGDDPYWTMGGDGMGRNELGKMMIQMRDRMRDMPPFYSFRTHALHPGEPCARLTRLAQGYGSFLTMLALSGELGTEGEELEMLEAMRQQGV